MINVKFLKVVLEVPTYNKSEYRIKEFICDWAFDNKIKVQGDKIGNLYLTKGVLSDGEYYPCVSAHLDTVFSNQAILAEKNIKKIIEINGDIIIGRDPLNNKRLGIGCDDLNGVFISLELMKKYDKIKAAFFVQEEYGCIGSRNADKDFFNDVAYYMQFDTPETGYTESLSSMQIYSDEFHALTLPLLESHKENYFIKGPYTDALYIARNFDFASSCLSAGYYNWHRQDEYTKLSAVEYAINLGKEFLDVLKMKKFIYTEKKEIY